MPRCDCGFDFVKAHIKKRRLVSYALIPHKTYRAAIRREYAIVEEKNSERKHRMIANASRFVGSLTQCPRCGSWLFDEPKRRTGFVVLRKTKNAANKPPGANSRHAALGKSERPGVAAVAQAGRWAQSHD